VSSFSRFVRTVTLNKFSDQSLFDARANKVTQALNDLHNAIADLVQSGVGVTQTGNLQAEYNRCHAALQAAQQQANGANTWKRFRDACDLLEPVKARARTTRDRAARLRGTVQLYESEPRGIDPNHPQGPKFNLNELLKEVAEAKKDSERTLTSVDNLFRHIAVLEVRQNRLQTQAHDLAQHAIPQGAANLQGNELKAYNYATAMVARLTARINDLTQLAQNHPFTEKEVYKSKAVEVDAAIKVLDDAMVKLTNANAPANKVVALNQVKVALQTRENNLQAMNSTDKVDSIEAILGPKGDPKKGADKKAKKVLGNNVPANIANLPLSSSKINEEALMKVVLEKALEHAQLTDNEKRQARMEDLHDRLNESHVKTLNEQNWNTITKVVQFTKPDDTVMDVQSTISPAAQLGDVFATRMNGHGVCCHDTAQYEHAVNLAYTEVADPNNPGAPLFAGLRHGINSAFGIRQSELAKMDEAEVRAMVQSLLPQNDWVQLNGAADLNATVARVRGDWLNPVAASNRKELIGKMRKQANNNRAQEIVLAALIKNPAQLQRAQQGQVAKITLNSMSLVTPDIARAGKDAVLGTGAAENEKKMLRDQMKAWERLDGQTIPVNINDPNNPGQTMQAQVKVRVNAFNFGVNEGAVGKGSPIVGGWGTSDKYNQRSMNRLIGTPEQRKANDGVGGQVLKWLDKNPLHADAAVVRELAKQVAEIWDQKDYKSQGVDPYKIVSRLAVLTHKMGNTPAFNCKSGKDRTGQLDVEVKVLATQIATTNGVVPKPDHELDEKEKRNRTEQALKGPNHDMQGLNTGGHKGFKLLGVPALDASYGSKETVATYRGTSDRTKS
jgi:hypothetical protein